MKTIKYEINNSITINKSEFITYLKPVNNVEDAKKYIAELKNKYPDATHHVSGYIVGKTGEYGHYTDDGEPSGTAGLPIFEVLRKNELTNLVFDCIRYFGGIKLGAGGLVRAYAKSISEAIKLVPIIEIIDYSYYYINLNYSLIKIIDSYLNDRIIKKEFSSNIKYLVKVEKAKLEQEILTIKNLTSNQAKIEILPDKDADNRFDEENGDF